MFPIFRRVLCIVDCTGSQFFSPIGLHKSCAIISRSFRSRTASFVACAKGGNPGSHWQIKCASLFHLLARSMSCHAEIVAMGRRERCVCVCVSVSVSVLVSAFVSVSSTGTSLRLICWDPILWLTAQSHVLAVCVVREFFRRSLTSFLAGAVSALLQIECRVFACVFAF